MFVMEIHHAILHNMIFMHLIYDTPWILLYKPVSHLFNIFWLFAIFLQPLQYSSCTNLGHTITKNTLSVEVKLGTLIHAS